MSKQNYSPRPGESAPAAPSEQPASPSAAQQPPASVPVSKARLWTFWGGIAAFVIAARALDYLLPGVQERVLERGVMLAFAAFLGMFLFKLK
ncbi:MAG: hypothetical protein A2X35_09435 [Elusimicrobia bacterium GWA2_61_42]|nr:MAG: hypothetical protein A2X35_09435 [Elusimicrobia bacterium GWA2_61_42]OGR78303.1 MAG: hypothetical protein A2X38_00030 [Elusimicrobia bacterium GWC2_61_25]